METGKISVEHISAEDDPEVVRDLLFYKLRGVLDRLLSQELLREARTPDSFNESTKVQLKSSIGSINEFLHFFGKTSDPLDANRNYGVFIASREVAKWVATYEKVKLNLPLSTPRDFWYLWDVDVEKETAARQQEHGFEKTDRNGNQGESQRDIGVSYHLSGLRLNPLREGETHEDRVFIRYDVNLLNSSEESL